MSLDLDAIALASAAKLLEQIQVEDPQSLEHGIHLIAVQSKDGSLVVGDSHHYGPVLEPFAREDVDALMLQHLQQALNLEQPEVMERWTGVYPSSPDSDCLIDQPDAATRMVIVTSGTGASTAFGIAEEVFQDW